MKDEDLKETIKWLHDGLGSNAAVDVRKQLAQFLEWMVTNLKDDLEGVPGPVADVLAERAAWRRMHEQIEAEKREWRESFAGKTCEWPLNGWHLNVSVKHPPRGVAVVFGDEVRSFALKSTGLVKRLNGAKPQQIRGTQIWGWVVGCLRTAESKGFSTFADDGLVTSAPDFPSCRLKVEGRKRLEK